MENKTNRSVIMKNEEASAAISYDLILGKFMYRVLESANLIPQNDFKRHFNPNGIKFPVEFTTKLARAQLESVKDYVAKNGVRELTNWYSKQSEDAKQYQELRRQYAGILSQQLKDIQYKKWKAMDRYLSLMSLKNNL